MTAAGTLPEVQDAPVAGDPVAHERSGKVSDDLRRLLQSELRAGTCSLGGVARTWAMHRRTLTRRLAAEGTAFRAIADEVRFEMARELLADPNLSLGQVAAALKFSEPSAFTRAFRRWSGQTPTAWRAARGPRAVTT